MVNVWSRGCRSRLQRTVPGTLALPDRCIHDSGSLTCLALCSRLQDIARRVKNEDPFFTRLVLITHMNDSSAKKHHSAERSFLKNSIVILAGVWYNPG